MFKSLNKAQKQLLFFLVKAIALYIIWVLIYDFYLEPSGKLDQYLNNRVANEASIILKLLGNESRIIPGLNQVIVQIDRVNMVGVGNPCNGLELFILFIGFIVCFPGPVKRKIIFIPIGIIIIHLVNSMRTSILALIQLHYPEHLDFNHHYTFTIIVYSLIFGLWMLWVNKFSKFDLLDNEASEK